jgi:hypothetical protein
VSSTKAFQRTTMLALQVEVPTRLMVVSNPDPAVGEEWWKTGLEAAGARSLHPVVAIIQLEAVIAMWKVDRLWEILPTTSRVLDYSENLVAQ